MDKGSETLGEVNFNSVLIQVQTYFWMFNSGYGFMSSFRRKLSSFLLNSTQSYSSTSFPVQKKVEVDANLNSYLGELQIFQ